MTAGFSGVAATCIGPDTSLSPAEVSAKTLDNGPEGTEGVGGRGGGQEITW